MPWTKAQRNATFRAVAAGKLNPAECEISEDDERLVITHGTTQSNFTAVSFMSGHYLVGITVGEEGPPSFLGDVPSFSDMIKRLRSWAEAVVEWRGPDLWEHRHDWQFLSDQREDSDNTPFSVAEQEAISAQLSAIRETIQKTYELTAE